MKIDDITNFIKAYERDNKLSEAAALSIKENLNSKLDGIGIYIAFLLACTESGQKILALENHRLAKLIHKNILYEVFLDGPCEGQSLLCWLAGSVTGRQILNIVCVHNKIQISDAIYRIFTNPNEAMKTLGMALFAMAAGHTDLSKHFVIKLPNINLVSNKGPFAYKSALSFAIELNNIEMLEFLIDNGASLDLNELTPKFEITQDMKDKLYVYFIDLYMQQGGDKPEQILYKTKEMASIARKLFMFYGCEELVKHVVNLVAHPYFKKGTVFTNIPYEKALQCIKSNNIDMFNTLTSSLQKELSLITAFMHARNSKGLKVLVADDYALANSINSETLNIVIPGFYNQSVAFCLARSEEGLKILATQDYRLAKLINSEALNTVITKGEFAGKSTAFYLSSTPEGEKMLALDNNRLGNLLSECNLVKSINQENEQNTKGNFKRLRMNM